MKTYKQFAPTPYDVKGLNLPDKHDWLVSTVMITSDSDCLSRANWQSVLDSLKDCPVADDELDSGDWETHSFNHWACGWFKILIARPGSLAEKILREIEKRLENYPVLDDDALSTLESEEADTIWRDCYNDKERIDYMRRYRSQFEAQSLADLLGCARGKYFLGYSSELVNR